MSKVNVPELLLMPDKLKPIMTELDYYRYFLLDGGRGGGKSHAVCRLILYLGELKKLRIVCARELQNTISESVMALLVDLISKYDLAWDVFRDRLVHKTTGSTINFRGLREQSRVNIKGLEAIDILFVDEAQSLTANTLEVVIPTIRREHARIFFAMNRYLKSDAVFNQFRNRDDCKYIKINYYDNPYISDALMHEAEVSKEDETSDYDHIWLGEPKEEADDYLFNGKELEACKHVDMMDRGQTPDVILGVDVARFGEDKTIGVILERMTGTRYQVSHIERWAKKDLMETCGRIMDLRASYHPVITVIDGDGVGAGVCDRLRENKIECIEFRGGHSPVNKELHLNRRAEGYGALKDLISRGLLKITSDSLLDELATIRFKFDSTGRRAMLRKEDMKKIGVKSPDQADALMMAVSEIPNIGVSLNVNKVTAFAQPRMSKRESVLRR